MFKLQRIVDFYMLNAMEKDLLDYGEFPSAPIKKLRDDITEFREELASHLALAIRDYCLITSAGEARYASGEYGQDYYVEYLIGRNLPREHVYAKAIELEPNSLIAALETLFLEKNWKAGSIGGAKWGMIASSCRRYGEWSNTAFVDYCIDLQHNNGTAFSKTSVRNVMDLDVLLRGTSIGQFLWYKTNYDLLRERISLHTHSEARLLVAYKTLKMFQRWKTVTGSTTTVNLLRDEHAKLEYEPVIWGDKPTYLVRKFQDWIMINQDPKTGKGLNGIKSIQCWRQMKGALYTKKWYAYCEGENAKTLRRDIEIKIAQYHKEMDASIEKYYEYCLNNKERNMKRAKNYAHKYIEEEMRPYLYSMAVRTLNKYRKEVMFRRKVKEQSEKRMRINQYLSTT